jgi:hypothetical protein
LLIAFNATQYNLTTRWLFHRHTIIASRGRTIHNRRGKRCGNQKLVGQPEKPRQRRQTVAPCASAGKAEKKTPEPQRGDRQDRRASTSVLPPLRGLTVGGAQGLRAHARSYFLSPRRGWTTTSPTFNCRTQRQADEAGPHPLSIYYRPRLALKVDPSSG